jgi:hypothetical protein
MKRIGYLTGVVALLGLTACEETVQGTATMLEPPPEYMDCRKVPRELAIADGKVEDMGVYDTFGAYWAKRSERLSSRAYECKSGRRR